MSRKKLARFEHNRLSENVLEPGKELYETVKGNWRERYFKNDYPIVVEVGCGRGEYTVGLARHYPHLNFVGIDRKGDRIAQGSQAALGYGLMNVAFVRTDAYRILDFFGKDEVNELWITFPDPQLRISQAKNRLTDPRFLSLYREMLVDEGVLHLKTDHDVFFDFSIETLSANGFHDLVTTRDLYSSEMNNLHLGIKTKYEEIFTRKGFSIKYLKCKKTAY
ncbi:tRNA (guanosine(46)-N7)-methyltransferase TrmB [Larkinella terrae]|uniref:tRNA (guanine-N(7)-)-methyltransferase n=1 Tax=Larkinella terrae TaxID=2025311 RepID=A0A7K0ELM7_9BACT|nr:tRNA (guanosine(46)-N7)-methyltransferase TrmB [Larkinella terrae]MRS62695.1 tRNA (guanosine(46)-N7)-methyltransferase TrmB [Larkinella terrae]